MRLGQRPVKRTSQGGTVRGLHVHGGSSRHLCDLIVVPHAILVSLERWFEETGGADRAVINRIDYRVSYFIIKGGRATGTGVNWTASG